MDSSMVQTAQAELQARRTEQSQVLMGFAVMLDDNDGNLDELTNDERGI